MTSLNSVQGAWRIEECPDGHAYGFPNSHWLIVGDRVMVIREHINDPRVFDMCVCFEPGENQGFLGLDGTHGGRGWAEVDGDLLFLSFGKNGVRPPRFASDCGLFFAFTRDHTMQLPEVETRSRDPIHVAALGRLEWDGVRHWIGSVFLTNGETCDLWISDKLRPVDLLIRNAQVLLAWLNENVAAVQTACGKVVREWALPEDEVHEDWPIEQFSKTIAISIICVDNFRSYLWAKTSIPIDHSLRVWLRTDVDAKFAIEDVSVDG